MLLNLNVPPLSKRVLADVELRPARVAKQVSELPMLNIVETSRRLASMIHINNRIEIIDSVRLELLELYRKPMHDLSVELQKLYLGQPIPLTERQNAAAEQDRQFQIEMALGYKRLVLNGTTGVAANNLPPADAALVIQRAIRHLAEAIAISYEIYSPYPFGAWQEIHALYCHAERLNVADVQIADPLNKTLPSTSVGHVYKQALLLDLADPYHLPARLTEKVQHYLDRWANLAVLLPANNAFDPTCQFLIDRNADHAGVANTHETTIEPPERYRLLNTVELARLVHMHLTAFNNGERPTADGLEDTFFNESISDLLKRLINVWGLHPKRSFRRNRSNQQKMDVAIGINAINYWLNGCTRFIVSSTFVGPTPPPRATDNVIAKKEMHPEMESVSWDVLDESAGGFSLALEGSVRVRVRVGDLMAVRAAGTSGAWSLAAVRWVRSPNASEIEIGAQRIAPAADAVVIKLMTDEGKESDFLPAMRLPGIKALNQAPSLITHCGVFRPKRQIFVDDGLRLQQIVATQAVEVTSAFERFQFQVTPA
jgi:hypothetical protein